MGAKKIAWGQFIKGLKHRIKEPGLFANAKEPFKDVKAGVDLGTGFANTGAVSSEDG